ncbi:MAG: ABC transporter permease [Lentisphaerae bacterium]|jgi:peptide/nickel transport system permease protein|nr:ABC transporter permease [Lentisphaerota bacterium]
MVEIWNSWWFQNTLVGLLVVSGIAVVLRLRRREYWRLAYREVCRRRGAVICFFVLCLYTLVALIDSVGWRDALRDENGELMRDPRTGKVVYDRGGSALDHLLKGISSKKEKTYSSPMSRESFMLESVNRDGKVLRERPPLKHPGAHLLGTDRIGQDVFCQALKSIRTGMVIGILTTLLAVPFALLLGVASGYYGGLVDDILQYICSVLSSIPTVLFIASFMLIFGRGLPQLCLAMGIASWTGLYRLLRGETLRLREEEFVQAAVAMGVPSWRVLLRHIVPNVMHLVLITAVLRFSSEVLAEAALTYLGIGVGSDTISWGTMINDARTELTRDPIIWWKLCTAFAFMLGLVLPANIFGDAVRDALDPRLRTQ